MKFRMILIALAVVLLAGCAGTGGGKSGGHVTSIPKVLPDQNLFRVESQASSPG